MIKINDTFSIEKEPYCWVLHTKYMGLTQKRTPKMQTKKSYHGSFKQIANRICHETLGFETLDSIQSLIEKIESWEEATLKLIEHKVEEGQAVKKWNERV